MSWNIWLAKKLVQVFFNIRWKNINELFHQPNNKHHKRLLRAAKPIKWISQKKQIFRKAQSLKIEPGKKTEKPRPDQLQILKLNQYLRNSQQQKSRTRWFLSEFYQIFRRLNTKISGTIPKEKLRKKGTLLNSFLWGHHHLTKLSQPDKDITKKSTKANVTDESRYKILNKRLASWL